MSVRKYRANELSSRQALAMAEDMAKAAGCRVIWIAWLRSESWGEFAQSDTLHDWTGGAQHVLTFKSERDCRRFLSYNRIGGDWQIQPYPTVTIEQTCQQNGVKWRHVEDSRSAWVVPLVDVVDPHTGEIVRVPHAERLATPVRPPGPLPPPYDLHRIRWRTRRAADIIGKILLESTE